MPLASSGGTLPGCTEAPQRVRTGVMARYQCRACGLDDHAPWHGALVCPRCGSKTHVRVAIAVEEMTAQEVHAMETARVDSADRE